MKKLLIKAGTAVLGVAVMLAWWSLTDRGGKTAEAQQIPAKVWEGGAGTLSIAVETSDPARMHVAFSVRGTTDRLLEATDRIAPGSRSWTIDVPAKASAFLSLSSEAPKVGSRLRWTVKVNGRVISEATETLNEPLRPGYAFGLSTEIADVARGELEP